MTALRSTIDIADTRPAPRRARVTRGTVEVLPSGSRRVRVYAGTDPVTHRHHYVSETELAGPAADTEVELARCRLLLRVAEGRHTGTGITLTDMIDRHLTLLQAGVKTVASYADPSANTSHR